MIAVQGPNAITKGLPLLPQELRDAAGALRPFQAASEGEWFVARTGYTGEDGFEVMLPEGEVVPFWKRLAEAGVHPCGLGARDTLRLEAGMNLYGSDMDESVSPLESGLAWTVDWSDAERAFIGRQALEAQQAAGGLRRFTGLVLEGKGVLRNHLKLFDGEREVGEITSGGFSPTLGRAIALARIAPDAGRDLSVEIRGRRLPVRQVKPPFVRHGQAVIDL
jgi:aminomethyltransferase